MRRTRRIGPYFTVVSALWLLTMMLLGTVAHTGRSVLADDDEIADLVRRTGLVDHLYDHVLLTELRVRSQHGIAFGETTFAVDDEDRAELVAAVEHILPRSWTELRVCNSAKAAGAYLDGSADKLRLDFVLGERALALSEATATLAKRRQVARRVHRAHVAPRFDQKVGAMMGETLGLPIDGTTLDGLALEVVPPAWIEAHLIAAVAASEPFMAGQTDSFAYRAPLEPVVRRGADALVEALRQDSVARELLLDQIVDPFIEAHLDEMDWPEGLRLEPEALRVVIRASIPPGWATEKGQSVVRTVERYLVGEDETLLIEVSVEGRKSALASALTDALLERVRARLEQLPRCGLFEISGATSAISSGTWPDCTPAGPDMVVSLVKRSIEDKVEAAIRALPDVLTVDEETLGGLLGADTLGELEDARARIGSGLVVDATLLGHVPGAPPRQPWLGALRAHPLEVDPGHWHLGLRFVRNVVSNEWLWWLIAAFTLATFSLTHPGSTRERVVRGLRMVLFAGGAVGVFAMALSLVDVVSPPTERASWLTEGFTVGLNAEVSALLMSIAMHWGIVAAVAMAVLASFRLRAGRPGRPR